RSHRRFRLADCADDVAALADNLGVEQAIVVGYSLGGPVAQLTWRRHRDLVAGLVLCATADCFLRSTRDRIVFTSMMSVAAGTSGLAALALRFPALTGRRLPRAVQQRQVLSMQQWAAREM